MRVKFRNRTGRGRLWCGSHSSTGALQALHFTLQSLQLPLELVVFRELPVEVRNLQTLVRGLRTGSHGRATGCLYAFVGEKYLDIPQWAMWQKIDRPSASKISALDEGSRGFSRPWWPRGNGPRGLTKCSSGSGSREGVPPPVEDAVMPPSPSTHPQSVSVVVLAKSSPYPLTESERAEEDFGHPQFSA